MIGNRSKGVYTSANWHPPVGGGLGCQQGQDTLPRCIECGARHTSAMGPDQTCRWCAEWIAAQNVKAVMEVADVLAKARRH